MTTTDNNQKKPRGFAAIDRARLTEIASKGGKAAHAAGTAHEFTPEEARVAGSKGGKAVHAKRGSRTALATSIVDGSTASKKSSDDDMVVDVACSSGSGCGGTVKAGTPEAAEAIGKPYHKGSKAPTGDDAGPATITDADTGDAQAAKDGSSADEDPTRMGSCGSGGCGSSSGGNPCG